MMDIVAAARQHLMSSEELLALLGSGRGFDRWLFIGPFEQSNPYVQMDGTQQAAIVLSEGRSWATPNAHNTMQFPTLQVRVYVDPVRDSAGNALTADLKPRFVPIHNEVTRLLHRPQGDVEMWGDVRTLGCQQLTSWSYMKFADTDGTAFSTAMFGLVLG